MVDALCRVAVMRVIKAPNFLSPARVRAIPRARVSNFLLELWFCPVFSSKFPLFCDT